jgi:hypothetical protein
MKTKTMQFGLALLSLLFGYHFSYADGFYIPEARKKIPNIPVQRALVKYHKGTEALIIESTLDGEGGDYGWIIPVPNPPKKFDKVSPGLLKTLSMQIQPKIRHVEPHGKVFGIRITVFFAITIIITWLCVMRWGPNASLIPLGIFILSLIIAPNIAQYRAGPGSSSKADPLVKITSSEIVGDYEVFVLDVQNSSALNTWLENNGFSKFPPEAAKLIDDYISHDWLFVVAKLRTILDGMATPHPILLEFEADRPVYPMKLTAIPGSTVYLELYVVGEKEAIPVNYSIKKEYCNFFDIEKIFYYRHGPQSDAPKAFIPREYFGPDKEIAHADALKVMWDGCVVTKFGEKITSREMMKDMFFRFKEAKPFQSELYSSTGKFNMACDVLLAVLIIVSILLIEYNYRRKIKGIRISISKLFIILLILGATGFGLSYALVGEKVDVYSVERYWLRNFRDSLGDFFYNPANTISTGERFIKYLQKEGINNPITNEPIIIEDSPGNIIVEETGGINLIKICLENGSLDTL